MVLVEDPLTLLSGGHREHGGEAEVVGIKMACPPHEVCAVAKMGYFAEYFDCSIERSWTSLEHRNRGGRNKGVPRMISSRRDYSSSVPFSYSFCQFLTLRW